VRVVIGLDEALPASNLQNFVLMGRLRASAAK